MFRSSLCIFTIGVLFFLTACGDPAANSNNAPEANRVPRSFAPPGRNELVELEKSAFEAWKNKDAKFFEGFLARRFVSTGPFGRKDRAAKIASIAAADCSINNYSFSEEGLTVLGGEAVALTLRADIDGVCDGKKVPSPVWSATVYVREDDNWKAAYRGEVPIASEGSKPAATTAATSSPQSAEDTAPDSTTQALLAVENHGWKARQEKNERILAAITMLDLAYFDPAGSGRLRRPAAVGQWMDPNCKVSSYTLSQPKGDLLEPNIGLLTYKADVTGSCLGRPSTPIWGATVFMKEMGFWKAILILHTPA